MTDSIFSDLSIVTISIILQSVMTFEIKDWFRDSMDPEGAVPRYQE